MALVRRAVGWHATPLTPRVARPRSNPLQPEVADDASAAKKVGTTKEQGRGGAAGRSQIRPAGRAVQPRTYLNGHSNFSRLTFFLADSLDSPRPGRATPAGVSVGHADLRTDGMRSGVSVGHADLGACHALRDPGLTALRGIGPLCGHAILTSAIRGYRRYSRRTGH